MGRNLVNSESALRRSCAKSLLEGLSGFLQKVAWRRHRKYEEFPGFGDETVEGFRSFLLGLERGLMPRDRHFWPQSSLLFQRFDRFDHVMRLENLASDIVPVLESIGRDPSCAMRLARPNQLELDDGKKITNAANRVNQFYDENTIDLVNRLYSRDFELFGYPRL